MSGFLGRYEYTLDDKGRISLPAAFRRQAEGESFVLLQWQSPALTLFPTSAWSEVSRRLLEFRRSSPEAQDQVLWITANAVDATPDKQGRILVPSWLKEAAGLEGPVLVIGALDRIELWNPARFAERARAAAGPEFDRFALKIFG